MWFSRGDDTREAVQHSSTISQRANERSAEAESRECVQSSLHASVCLSVVRSCVPGMSPCSLCCAPRLWLALHCVMRRPCWTAWGRLWADSTVLLPCALSKQDSTGHSANTHTTVAHRTDRPTQRREEDNRDTSRQKLRDTRKDHSAQRKRCRSARRSQYCIDASVCTLLQHCDLIGNSL